MRIGVVVLFLLLIGMLFFLLWTRTNSRYWTRTYREEGVNPSLPVRYKR